MVELSVQSALDAVTESKIFKWSDENLTAQLPLQPGSSASLTLYLYAATDFVTPTIRNGNEIAVRDLILRFRYRVSLPFFVKWLWDNLFFRRHL